MDRMKRAALPFLGLALTAGALAACGEGEVAETDQVSVMLDWELEGQYGPLLYGVANGIFSSHGIEVDIIPGRGSDLAMGQINEGEVDFAFTDLETFLAQRANEETDTTAVYAWLNKATLGIVSHDPIENPEDMAGLTWGSVGFSAGPRVLPFVLEVNGVDPGLVTIELVDFAVLYPLFFEGELDSAEAHSPGSAEGVIRSAEEQGLTVHFKPVSDWGLRGYSKMLVAPNATLAENPELVARFVAAIHESLTEAMANATTEEISQLIADFDPATDAALQGQIWESFVEVVVDPGPLDAQVIRETLDRLAQLEGVDPSGLAVEDLFTNEFIPAP